MSEQVLTAANTDQAARIGPIWLNPGVSRGNAFTYFYAAFFTIGLKVGPLYIQDNLITGILQELIDNGEADNMTISDIRDRVSNGLRINNVTGFDLNDIRMRRQAGRTTITVNYERRVEMFANLDIVAKFDSTLQ